MSSEQLPGQMTIEKLELKIENQSRLIKELTNENEELFHQYNHIMIRNGKLLKRVDDLQKIIDDLHLRIEELQLINGNMMQINDRLRKRSDNKFSSFDNLSAGNDDITTEIKTELYNDLDLESISDRWKVYPGQVAQNGPNLRKQVTMMAHLYKSGSLSAADLFRLSGLGGVTGARYVSVLKKFGLIRYTGARKKGFYEMTRKGIDFIENRASNPLPVEGPVDNPVFLKSDERLASSGSRISMEMDHNDL